MCFAKSLPVGGSRDPWDPLRPFMEITLPHLLSITCCNILCVCVCVCGGVCVYLNWRCSLSICVRSFNGHAHNGEMVFTTVQSTGSNKIIKLLDIYGAGMLWFFRLQRVVFFFFVIPEWSQVWHYHTLERIRLNPDLRKEPQKKYQVEYSLQHATGKVCGCISTLNEK